MKIALFADGAVGKEIALYLLQNYLSDVSLIITVDDNVISEIAKKYKIKTFIFSAIEGAPESVAADVELGILAWWPFIIKSPLLGWPKSGYINTHPSMLPYNRGKHANFWALVEKVPFGVTLHRVDSTIDTGAIVAQMQIPYDWTDDGESLYKKGQSSIAKLFQLAYPKIRVGCFESKEQNSAVGTFHNSSEIEMASEIKLEKTYKAENLLNLLRAKTFNGYAGCWFTDGGDKYEISVKITRI
jgi:methionyl-tRNA formyltransferase